MILNWSRRCLQRSLFLQSSSTITILPRKNNGNKKKEAQKHPSFSSPYSFSIAHQFQTRDQILRTNDAGEQVLFCTYFILFFVERITIEHRNCFRDRNAYSCGNYRVFKAAIVGPLKNLYSYLVRVQVIISCRAWWWVERVMRTSHILQRNLEHFHL